MTEFFREIAFNSTALSFDHKSTTWMEFINTSEIYGLLLSYIPNHLIHEEDPKSFTAEVNKIDGALKNSSELKRVRISLGLGEFSFTDISGRKLRCLHQSVGKPIGTGCGAEWYKSLILFSPGIGSQESLASFLNDLVKAGENTEVGTFTIYTWHLRHNYWRKEKVCKARVLESVILPSKVKDKLFVDVDRFLDAKTRLFYEKHGIPYRRSYLFFGVPGAGKTSLIQALAGKLNRNLYFVQPSNPLMTDDSLRSAISEVPENGICVIEDIDALFTKMPFLVTLDVRYNRHVTHNISSTRHA